MTGYLYIDAVQVATGRPIATLRSLNSSNGVSIGADTVAKSTFFSGTIDNVQIYAAAISANGIASLATAAPTITKAAAAAFSPVTGTTAPLSVLGADDAGESTLTYTWATTGTPPAAVTFSANGTNAAKATTATFTAAGAYNFTVTAVDAFGLKATSGLSVTVNQTFTSFAVNSLPFGATALDQFGNPLPPASQPSDPWSLSGSAVAFASTPGVAVNLDGASPSLAGVTFNGTGYTIGQQGAGETLQLAGSAGPATLIVAAANSDTISAPVALESNVTVLPAAGSQLNISGGVSGAGSLTVDAPGTVVLSGANSYTGGTTVTAGTLVVNNASAIAAYTSLTVSPGGTFIYDPSVAASSADAVAATTPAIVSSADTFKATSAATSGNTSVTPAATVATPPVALPRLASPPARQTNNLSEVAAAGALGTPAAERVVGSSITKGLFQNLLPSPPTPLPQGEGSYADLAWLGQAANDSDNSDALHKKAPAILALEAVFAQYGR